MNTDTVALPEKDKGPSKLDLARAALAAKPATSERKHHPFSPSKLQYLEGSPAYVGRQTDSQASKDGTLQHDASEADVSIDDLTLPDEFAEAVAMCKAYREQLIAKHPGGTVYKEVYLPIDDRKFTWGGEEWLGTTAGYTDLAVVSANEEEGEVADWKFGQWSVEPTENNLQGMAYLLGVFKKHPKLKRVTVHFVMPHREELDTHTFTSDQFQAMYLRICVVVARAMEVQSQPKPTAACKSLLPTCLWCANIGKCDPVSEFSMRVAKKYHPPILPEVVTPGMIHDPREATKVMEIAQLMEAWAKAVRNQITGRVIEDDAWMPEGYSFQSRTDCDMPDHKKVIEFAKSKGVPQSAIDEATSLAVTPLNKAISDAAPRGAKKTAMAAFKKEMIKQGLLVPKPTIYFLERIRS